MVLRRRIPIEHGFGDAGNAVQAFPLAQIDEPHPLGVAADDGHPVAAGAHQGAEVADEHQFIAIEHLQRRHQFAVALTGLHGDDALGAPSLNREFAEPSALAVAPGAGGEQQPVLVRDDQGDHPLAGG